MVQPIIPGLVNSGDLITVKGNRDFTAALLKRFPRLIGLHCQARDRLLVARRIEARQPGSTVVLHFDRDGRFYPFWTGRAALALETKSATVAEVIGLNYGEAWGHQLMIVGDGVRLVETSL